MHVSAFCHVMKPCQLYETLGYKIYNLPKGVGPSSQTQACGLKIKCLTHYFTHGKLISYLLVFIQRNNSHILLGFIFTQLYV